MTRVVVVGGGIAGVSLGYELAHDHEVVVLEGERALAQHSTGRSAALFVAGLGSEPVKELSQASLPLFDELQFRLGTAELLRQRGGLFTAWDDEEAAALQGLVGSVPALETVSTDAALSVFPFLRTDSLAAVAYDPTVADIDVMALHSGYLHGLRRRGGEVQVGARVTDITRTGAAWRVERADGRAVEADVVVNAAGAWGDAVNAVAGAPTSWLTPCRRTAVHALSPRLSPAGPVVGDARGTWYLKPEGEGVLVSPCDETPVQACDVRADELDVACALERVNERTLLELRSVRTAWAGLRTFAADHLPVVGWHPEVEGLFCFLGQGGYGIQAGPALARVAAQVLRGEAERPDLSPGRLDVVGVA
jgi:D-arginine dehydrogenase